MLVGLKIRARDGTKILTDFLWGEVDIANDSDVDLVVCSVRVDRHLETIGPSLRKGKDVYVEWPLGKNLAEAEKMLLMKNEGEVKNAVVGLQARQAPIIQKVKSIIDKGDIGRVLSSSWVGMAGTGGGSTTEPVEYLGRKEVGGNLVTIHFGHSIDYIQYGLWLCLQFAVEMAWI